MIYILEDDDSIRKLIEYSLKTQNFEVLSFARPSAFWESFEKQKPDLILLDIMLPEEDGISILKKLRAMPESLPQNFQQNTPQSFQNNFQQKQKPNSSIPVIMLTAKDTEYDVVTGLDAGADDYVTKPFGMMALISRIKAVLRRYENKNSENKALKIGGIEIDENQHTVFAGNAQIFLTVKEFDLLLLLMKNQGKVFTREQLLEAIWEINTNVESRTVDVHIRTLRQKLGEYEKNIETIRGLGYKFV